MVVAIIIRGGRRHSDCRMRRKWPRDEEMNEAESERRKGARTVSVTVFTTRDRRSFVSFSPPLPPSHSPFLFLSTRQPVHYN